MSLFSELKRRNVFKVAVAYVVMAWLVIQVADVILNNVEAPGWVFHVILLLVGIGLFLTIFFAWAFELTPDGLKREHDVDRSQSVTHQTGRKLDFVIIGVLAVGMSYLAYDKFVLSAPGEAEKTETITKATGEQEAATKDETSIAVLPFVNMSDDASNVYFSDGLSEELLNLLVKIPELRVAARTSSFSFKDKDLKISEIAQELNVSHVLEGSVRKSGNQVRITAQLIKADDGFHLWSENFDLTLNDIFAVQDEIATAVVNGLKITLLGAMPEHLETAPEVYSLYLQGKYFMTLPRRNKEELEKAVSAFEQALAIDPDYAPAWVGLSWAYEYQSRLGVYTKAQGTALAREAADRALAIDDNLALAWSALSYLKKKYDWDWEGAKAAMDKALQLEPNNIDVLLGTASVASTLGQLDKSIELLERAVALDPLGLNGLLSLGRRYVARGRYDEALETYHRVLGLYPENSWSPLSIAETYLRQGNPERALAAINKLPYSHRLNSLKAETLFTMGEEEESRALTSEFLNTPAQENPFPKAFIYAWRGENDSAFESLELAFEQHHYALADFLLYNTFGRLEGDPRYPLFLEKLGLLKYWKAMPPE